jgi:hypothetical protein
MTTQEEKKRAKKWRTIGGIVLVLLLAAAAFYAGLWTVGRASGMRQVAAPEAFQALLADLEETPDQVPDLAGAVESVKGSSIFVATLSGQWPGASTAEEPPVEVVVGPDTLILADVTAVEFLNNITGGTNKDGAGWDALGEEPARVIEPGALEDIKPKTMIWIWGDRDDGRLNASTLLYLVSPIGAGN